MRNKKHLAAGKRKASLTALALVACMLLTLAGTEIGSAKADPINLNTKCSLTVKPGDLDNRKDLVELENTDVVIDLYKVADAKEVPGYDTYSFGFEDDSPYKSLEEMLEGEAIDYQAAAQEAARITFPEVNDEFTSMDKNKVITGQPSGTKIEGLESGLYLLIARSPKLTAADEYVTEVAIKDTVAGDNAEQKATAQIATIAYSEQYTYTYLPELIALPSKDAIAVEVEGEVESVVNTANPGDWITDLTVTLKPEPGPRYGSLEIVKNISDYVAGEPASFVFRIEATKDGEKVYSDVETITFSGAGQERRMIDKIPVGALVEVTEVYSGVSYVLDKEQDRVQTAEIPTPEDGAAAVTFTNIYQGTTKNGGAVINSFEYITDEGWDWDPIVPGQQ